MKCLGCENEFEPRKANQSYCTAACASSSRGVRSLAAWKRGEHPGYKRGFRINGWLRDYILEKVGYRCQECGWDKKNPKSGKCPLEVNHKDGDCTNCREDNLEALCPNCHALTPTWKALNKGNGNRFRHQYSGLVA